MIMTYMVVTLSYDKVRLMIKFSLYLHLEIEAVKNKPVSSSFSVTVTSLVSCLEHEGSVLQVAVVHVINAVPDIRYPVRHWYTAISPLLYGLLVITVPPVIEGGSAQPWKEGTSSKSISKKINKFQSIICLTIWSYKWKTKSCQYSCCFYIGLSPWSND